ncbi:MAG: tetratricopeptide repeat protein, partial [Nitrospinota bacterium]
MYRRKHRLFSLLLALYLMSFLLLFVCERGQPAAKQTMKIHVLVTKTRAEAEEVLKLLRQGIPFTRLVRERSIGPNREKGGDMGYIDPDQVSPRVKQLLKGLGEGEYSTILQTELGYTIFYHTTDRYYQEGKAHFQAGKLLPAVEALEKDIQLNPEREESLFLLGTIYESRELYDQALSLFQRIVEIDPESVLAYNALGLVYEKMGNFRQAEAMYNKALALNPDFYEARNNLANIYVKTGRTAEAMAEYNRAINAGADAAPVYYNLARLYAGMDSKLSEAITLMKRAILLAPREARYREMLARLYVRSGEHDLAVAEMRKALSLDPQNSRYRQALKQLEEAHHVPETGRPVTAWSPDHPLPLHPTAQAFT